MNTTSITLLQRVQANLDPNAWRRFADLYSPLLYHWSVRAGLTESDAVDVVQDVFVVLLRELSSFVGRYDKERGNFRGWLKTITVRKVTDMRRKRRPKTGDSAILDGVEADPLEAIWDQEYQRQVVRRALELMQTDFETNTWRACWETTVNDRPAREVAIELGMNEAAVYVAKSRVLRRLREEFSPLIG